MKNIKVVIAENNYLIRKGFCSVVSHIKDFSLVAEIEESNTLIKSLAQYNPDVLIIDYNSGYFNFEDIQSVRQKFPHIKILAITDPKSKLVVSKAISYGITGHLLKSCGKEEIIEAIYSTYIGQKFMCEKIVAMLLEEQVISATKTNCDGVKISDREIEVLLEIANGLANKQIADKLNISLHTVTTHRKNIMAKLKINNTASLVMYAVRENLMSPVYHN